MRGGSSPSAGMPRSPFTRAGSVRVTAAMKGAQGCDGHQVGACADCAAGQLVSDRAVPARQGDQIAAAISGHQPSGPGKRRQIKTFRNGRDGPCAENTSPAQPPNLTRTVQTSEPGSRAKTRVWLGRTTAKCRWSSVAISVSCKRSAMAITAASTMPSGDPGRPPQARPYGRCLGLRVQRRGSRHRRTI